MEYYKDGLVGHECRMGRFCSKILAESSGSYGGRTEGTGSSDGGLSGSSASDSTSGVGKEGGIMKCELCFNDSLSDSGCISGAKI